MPRSRSMSIQSDVTPRRPPLPCTAPAAEITSACRASASVSVDLPASGWLITANVRRRRAWVPGSSDTFDAGLRRTPRSSHSSSPRTRTRGPVPRVRPGSHDDGAQRPQRPGELVTGSRPGRNARPGTDELPGGPAGSSDPRPDDPAGLHRFPGRPSSRRRRRAACRAGPAACCRRPLRRPSRAPPRSSRPRPPAPACPASGCWAVTVPSTVGGVSGSGSIATTRAAMATSCACAAGSPTSAGTSTSSGVLMNSDGSQRHTGRGQHGRSRTERSAPGPEPCAAATSGRA